MLDSIKGREPYQKMKERAQDRQGWSDYQIYETCWTAVQEIPESKLSSEGMAKVHLLGGQQSSCVLFHYLLNLDNKEEISWVHTVLLNLKIRSKT